MASDIIERWKASAR